MKKLLKAIAITFVVIMVLGALAGNSTSNPSSTSASPSQGAQVTSAPQSTDVPQPTDVPTDVPTAVPVLTVDIHTLAGQYDANKLRAQAYYKDRVIETTGVAGDVSQDILGSYYVSLQVGGDYYGLTQVQCYVSDQNQLVNVTNGHNVTVRGRVDDMTLGIIPLKDCAVVS